MVLGMLRCSFDVLYGPPYVTREPKVKNWDSVTVEVIEVMEVMEVMEVRSLTLPTIQ